MICRTCHGSGLIESGGHEFEPYTETYCECEAGIEAEQRDAVSFAVLDHFSLMTGSKSSDAGRIRELENSKEICLA